MAIPLLAGIGSFVGGLFGGGSKKKLAAQQADFAKKLEAQKAELNRQMALEAQQNKKTMTMVGIGAGGLVLIMMLFMFKK